MFRKRFYYLLEIQYLGFRYHGWQKQPDVNTVQRMLERSMKYMLDQKFKTLCVGRTDAKVSARQTFIEIFVEEMPLDLTTFLEVLNINLPSDIRALSIKQVTESFNLLQAPKLKEYQYLFAHGQKFDPFCAPFMVTIHEKLDIEMMQKALALFVGTHDFRSYAYKANENTQTVLEITEASLEKNEIYTANFFPEESYLVRFKGAGFKRNQIRLLMGVLFDIGKGKIDLEFIKQTLEPKTYGIKLSHIAPASGLTLHKVSFLEPIVSPTN